MFTSSVEGRQRNYFLISFLIMSFIFLEYSEISAQNGWVKLPVQTTISRAGSGACAIGDSIIYVIGGLGFNCEGLVETFNPETLAWQTKDSMITPRAFFACGELDNKIYIMGGGYPDSSNKNEVYDVVSDQWLSLNNMPGKRQSCTASVVDGLIYVIGGIYGVRDCWSYDPASDSYIIKQSMPEGSGGVLSSVSYNGLIYTFGGATNPPIVPLNNVYAYNPVTDQWIRKQNMPTARFGAKSFLINNKIYVIGGSQAENTALNTVEVYDPVNDSWESLPDMPQAMVFFSGAVLNNKIYLFGGTEDWAYPIRDVWEYTVPTAVENEKNNPGNFILSQNYPNPFNPVTNIEYSIPEHSLISIKIYDILGKQVAELINKEQYAGNYNIVWDAGDFPSGVFFYQLKVQPIGTQTRSSVQTKKMILLR